MNKKGFYKLNLGRNLLVLSLCLTAIAFFQTTANAQCVSLTTLGAASTQSFDTLSNTAGTTTNNLTITGWFMTETGGGARDNEQYAVDNGTSTTGDTFSYGAAASSDRALGSLQSGTLISTFGACFTNNTGTTISTLNIAYTGEQWRLGTTARTDQIDFQYSTNATDLTTGTWTDVNALDFVTPDTGTVGAKDGNAAPTRTALTSTIAPISIANGATFWIRWLDFNASGADDGLAVDDFSLTPNAALAAGVTIAGRILSANGTGINNATVTLTLQNGETLTTRTGSFGYYAFEEIEAGQTVNVSVSAKRRNFAPRIFSVSENISDADFTELPDK